MAIHQYFDREPAVSSPTSEWWRRLPVLEGPRVTLRELNVRDAASLLKHLSGSNVHRYVTRPPSTLDAVKDFIRWTRRVRQQRRYIVYGVIPAGHTEPVGVMQIWKVESDFSVAECGFVLGEAFWGQGLFVESARLLLGFAFETLGVHRVEARVVDVNTQAQTVLKKIGATREARLRESFKDGDTYRDHILWALTAGDWAARPAAERKAH